MDKDSFSKHKPYAGAKQPSMKRRRIGHDYSQRRLYLITIVVEGRKPLLGKLVKTSDGAATIEPSQLGIRVSEEWNAVNQHHPEVTSVALQLMPDHLHGILFVHEPMATHLGSIIKGFKAGCNKAYRDLVGYAATALQHGEQSGQKRGLLFERGYNDQILEGPNQLNNWISYLRGNPRRLMMRREQPELFRVRFNQEVAGHSCSMLGNRFLLERPDIRAVQCSRRLTEEEIARAAHNAVEAAQHGAVHVSPAISAGEKAVMRALLDAGMPLIFLAENGLTPYSKPSGEFFNACTRGQLLIIAPWEHHNEHIAITRQQCLALNSLSAAIASSN